MTQKITTEAELSLITYAVDDITSRTHLSRSITYARIADGSLRAFKDGARTFVLHEDLMTYLKSRPVANPAAPELDESRTSNG